MNLKNYSSENGETGHIRLTELVEVNPAVDCSHLKGEDEVSFIPMSDLTENAQWATRQSRFYSDVQSGYSAFAEGDILFAKITPCTENGKGCHAINLTNGVGFGSTEFHILRAKPGVNSRLIYHLSVAKNVRAQAAAMMGGSAGQQRVPSDFFRFLLISRRCLDKQNAYANLFDAMETAIEQTRAVIDQTRKLKTAVLQDLLSNGLPGMQNGHRKVRWLGKAPKKWRLCSLGELVREPIRNGYSPNCPARPTGRWVLSLSAVSSEGYRPTGVKPAPPNDPKVLETKLVPGDILVSRSNTRNLVGLAGVYDGTPTNCSYPDLLMRVRIDSSKANPDYVLAVLLSGGSRSYFAQTSRGTSGSMKKIDREILENLPVPLPTSDEQDAIVRISDSFGQRIRQETVLLERAVRLKQALSQALLTGRIRVPVRGSK